MRNKKGNSEKVASSTGDGPLMRVVRTKRETDGEEM